MFVLPNIFLSEHSTALFLAECSSVLLSGVDRLANKYKQKMVKMYALTTGQEHLLNVSNVQVNGMVRELP